VSKSAFEDGGAIRRLGYERRAVWAQLDVCWIVLPMSFWLTDPAKNIDWVFRLGYERAAALAHGVPVVHDGGDADPGVSPDALAAAHTVQKVGDEAKECVR
jgi:hypothetical protein